MDCFCRKLFFLLNYTVNADMIYIYKCSAWKKGVSAYAVGSILWVVFGVSRKYGGTYKKKSRYCDGDCDSCLAYYGYRYGRRYYGHGHQWVCERHGNGGRTGRTYRD